MSRNARRRRERLVLHDWDAPGALAGVAIVPGTAEDREAIDRLGEENDRLRERAEELGRRYRLACRDRESIRADRNRAHARSTRLQAELDRLSDEYEGLRSRVERARADPWHPETIGMEEVRRMNRFATLLGFIRRNKAASVAVLAVGALVARDPIVSGAARSVAETAASAVTRGGRDGPAEDGYVQYARMVAAAAEYDAARRDYNASSDALAGDELLEAQDGLRAARLRDREARLAFLPELSRRCADAGVPVPEDAAAALADLQADLAR
ncbi:hypothetical protein [Tautonia plasticadhaerens]|uniref:hypothetical protein n=1 Tax=Tautonia plasticadhaerens TaxID=2527974 RepID=UPI0011A1814B|nr:hypothetical protein [Tautonia plasticadhaerens]